jgi:hypothetical protein
LQSSSSPFVENLKRKDLNMTVATKEAAKEATRTEAAKGGGLTTAAAVLAKVLATLKRPLSALNRLFPVVKERAGSHLRYLGKLSPWLFVLWVGLWTVLFKAALEPFTALLGLILRPLGMEGVFSSAPLVELADSLTQGLYQASFLPLGWNSLSAVSQLAVTAVLFPAAATLLAQLLPLVALKKPLPSERWRIYLSLVFMGLVSLFAWDAPALLVTGAALGIPLAYSFLHWRRRASAGVAFLVTGGVHALANSVVILFHALLGGAR